MHVSGTGWALTTASVVSVVTLGPDAATLTRALGGPSFPDALVAAASLVLLVASAWVVLAVALTGVAGSSRWARALTPQLLRRALFTGAAGAMVVVPAHASSLDTDRGSPPAAHSVSGLKLPDRPDIAPVTEQRRDGVPAPRSAAQVVVRPGDTLWAVAARSLPPGAPDADIVRACAAWHAVNRDVIGDDPDRIFPLQRLTPPTGKDSS